MKQQEFIDLCREIRDERAHMPSRQIVRIFGALSALDSAEDYKAPEKKATDPAEPAKSSGPPPGLMTTHGTAEKKKKKKKAEPAPEGADAN